MIFDGRKPTLPAILRPEPRQSRTAGLLALHNNFVINGSSAGSDIRRCPGSGPVTFDGTCYPADTALALALPPFHRKWIGRPERPGGGINVYKKRSQICTHTCLSIDRDQWGLVGTK